MNGLFLIPGGRFEVSLTFCLRKAREAVIPAAGLWHGASRSASRA
jgi:hypothetical protein